MFLLSVGFCSSLLQMGKLGSNPLAGLAALGLGGLATPANTGGLNPAGKSTIYCYFATRHCVDQTADFYGKFIERKLHAARVI